MYSQPSFHSQELPRTAPAGAVSVDPSEEPIQSAQEADKLTNPIPPTDESRERGRQLYQTYCIVCHGPDARGDGPVAAKFQRPPDLTQAKYKAVSDGYIYWLMGNGFGVMPPLRREPHAD